MNKENNLGSIISVVVVGAVAGILGVSAIFVGGKEVIRERIEIVDRDKTIDRDYETIDRTEGISESFGGLVHNVQEIFAAGIKAGTSEAEVINSSGVWVYQISGTTGAFSGTLSVTGDLAVNTDDLFVDVSAQMVGIGTTTPGTMLEISGSPVGTGIAPYITLNNPTTTDSDFGLVFEDNFTQVAIMYFDDSANKLVIATSTDQDVITIDNDGNIVLVDATSLSSTLTVTGESNLDTLVFGGTVFSSTTAGAAGTLTAANICDNSVIRISSAGGDGDITTVTITFPATSTLYADCIPTAGDTKVLLYENGSAVATSTTLAAGTGGTLLEPSGGDVVIEQNEWATLEFTNVDLSEVAVVVTSLQNAD